MKLKVVYIIGQLSIGGSEKYIVNLVSGLNKNKFDMQVVCLSSKLELQPALINAGCKVHVINPRHFRRLRTILFLHRLLKHINPNIIHAVGRSWYYAILASIGINSKIVVSSQSIPEWKRWFHKISDKLLLRKISLFLANANQVKKATWDGIGMSADKCSVIYTGLDFDSFDREFKKEIVKPIASSISQIETNPVLILVARLTPEKSINTLIEAHQQIIKSYPTCQLWVIGEGRSKSNLKKLTYDLNLTNHVHFWGRRNDIPALLAKANIGVLCSKSEGLPTSITEYMAAKLPIVSTNVGGIQEQLVHNVTGILVPANSPDTICKAICNLLSDTNKMHQMGLAGRQVAEKKFSISKMISEHEHSYNSLI